MDPPGGNKSFVRRQLRKHAKAARHAATTPKKAAKRGPGFPPEPPPPPPPPLKAFTASVATQTDPIAENMDDLYTIYDLKARAKSLEIVAMLVARGVEPFRAARIACIPDADWGVFNAIAAEDADS